MTQLKTLIALATTALLAACGGGGGYEGPEPTPQPRPNPQPNPPTQLCSTSGLAAAAQSAWPVACMLTSSGEMVIELYDEYAPITVGNFLNYVNTNFYSSTLIHRVDAGFVIQGGGYTSGHVRKPNSTAPITLEDNTVLSNLRGTIAMARSSEPNSATSEFFFKLDNNSALDGTSQARGYAVFGKIISGLTVMDSIAASPVYRYSQTDIRPQTEVLVYWVKRIQ